MTSIARPSGGAALAGAAHAGATFSGQALSVAVKLALRA